jgi:transglutaminase/protease-like cytokinesis protein 3
MRYFLSDPEFLLIDHFPEDSIWQLRDDPISYSEFSNDYWTEMRFRKFNNLLYDEDYQNYLKLVENVKPYNNKE